MEPDKVFCLLMWGLIEPFLTAKLIKFIGLAKQKCVSGYASVAGMYIVVVMYIYK